MSFGIQVEGALLGNTIIDSESGNPLLVPYEGPSLLAPDSTTQAGAGKVGYDANDIIFVRPRFTSVGGTVFNVNPKTTGTNIFQYKTPDSTYQRPGAGAAQRVSFIRARPSDVLSGTGVSDGSSFGAIVKDASGNKIFDSRNTSSGLDIVSIHPPGTVNHGGRIFTFPDENFGNYYVAQFGTYFNQFNFSGLGISLFLRVNIGGAVFRYNQGSGNGIFALNTVRNLSTNTNLTTFTNFGTILIAELKQ